MARISRMLEAAKAVALSGPGVGGRNGTNFRIGAVLFSGNHVISAKHNELKTHPKLARYSPWPFLHAESSCILHAGFDASHGVDLAVSRVKRDGSVALAKPCTVCQAVIRQAGIRRVFYTTDDKPEVWNVADGSFAAAF